MRLKPDQAEFIKRTIAGHFGEDARVWLFGSRVDDSKRGGDVDLYVVPQTWDALFEKRVRCLGQLQDGLPYPVDLVLSEPGSQRPIDQVALKSGVLL